jgi:hypothetical protein
MSIGSHPVFLFRKPISNQDEIIGPLGDCLAWCAPLVDNPVLSGKVGKAFRSSQFAEAATAVFPNSGYTNSTPSMDTAFTRFLELRHHAVESNQCDRLPSADLQDELRRPMALLLTDWQSALFDGSVSHETHGFMGQALEHTTGELVTDHYFPPWDTWLALVNATKEPPNRSLLSWVPHWLSQSIDRSIAMEVTACLAWCEVSRKRLIYNYGWGETWS